MAWIEIEQRGGEFEQGKLPRRKDVITVGATLTQLKKRYGKDYKKYMITYARDREEHNEAFRRNIER